MPKPPVKQGTPTDTMQPWTIKAFPTALKLAIIDAATDERITVGQWLERVVNQWMQVGQPRRIAVANPVANQVANPVSNEVYAAMTGVERASAVAEFTRLALALSAPGQPDTALLKTARIGLRAELLALRRAGFTSSETGLTAPPAAPPAPTPALPATPPSTPAAPATAAASSLPADPA